MQWRSAQAPNSASAPGAPPLNRMKSVFCMVTHAVRRSAPIYADGFARFFAAVGFGAAALRVPPFAAAVFGAVFVVVFLVVVLVVRADVAAFVGAAAAL